MQQSQDSGLQYRNIDAPETKKTFAGELKEFIEGLSPDEQARILEKLNSMEDLEDYIAFYGSPLTREERLELLQFLVGQSDALSDEMNQRLSGFFDQTITLEFQEVQRGFQASLRVERILVWIPDKYRVRVRNLLERLGIK